MGREQEVLGLPSVLLQDRGQSGGSLLFPQVGDLPWSQLQRTQKNKGSGGDGRSRVTRAISASSIEDNTVSQHE